MDGMINVDEGRAYAREHWPSPVVRRPLEDVFDNCTRVDAEPVRHGQWEWHEEEYTSDRPDLDYGWRCSCCKEDLEQMLMRGLPNTGAYINLDDPEILPTLKRCPNCGAKMDGGSDNEKE